MAALVPPGIRHERGAARKSGSTLQKIAQKKEQLRHYPRVKKLERIATHLHCEVRQILHTEHARCIESMGKIS